MNDQEKLQKIFEDVNAIREYGADVQGHVGKIQTALGVLEERVAGLTHHYADASRRHSARLRAITDESQERDEKLAAASERRDEAILERVEDMIKRIEDGQKGFIARYEHRDAAVEARVQALETHKIAQASFLNGGKFVATLIGGAVFGLVQWVVSLIRG